MRYLLLGVVVYAAAVTETSLVDVVRLGDVTPDLLALLAVGCVLFAPGRRAFLVAGVIALVGDLVAPGRLGVGAAWMLLIGYAITRLRAKRIGADHLPGQLLVVGAAVTIWAGAVGLTGRLLGDVSLPCGTIAVRALGVGLYSAAVSLPVLMVVGWIREPYFARRRKLADF